MRKRRLATGTERVATATVLHGTPVETVVGSVTSGPARIAVVATGWLSTLVATRAVVTRWSGTPVVVGINAVAATIRLAVFGFLLFDIQLDTIGTVAGKIYWLKVEINCKS